MKHRYCSIHAHLFGSSLVHSCCLASLGVFVVQREVIPLLPSIFFMSLRIYFFLQNRKYDYHRIWPLQ